MDITTSKKNIKELQTPGFCKKKFWNKISPHIAVRRWDTITRTRHFVQGKRGYLSTSRLRPISGTHTRKYKNIKVKRKWKGGHNIKKKKKHDKRLYFTIPTTTLSSGVIISSSFYCYFGCPGERRPQRPVKEFLPPFPRTVRVRCLPLSIWYSTFIKNMTPKKSAGKEQFLFFLNRKKII